MSDDRTLVLLGAGASADAGIPVSAGLTREIVKEIDRPRPMLSNSSRALNIALAAMTAHSTAQGKGFFDGVDVEALFSAVQMLTDRAASDAAPFVSAWNPGLTAVMRHSLPHGFDQKFQRAIGNKNGLGTVFASGVAALTSVDDGAVFTRLRSEMLLALRTILDVTDRPTDYLSPLIDLPDRPLTIATLNYDLSVERMVAGSGVSMSTGIEWWTDGFDWQWLGEPDVQILKLHGSLDWEYTDDFTDGKLRSRRLMRTDAPDPRRTPGIIFGDRQKLTADGPFLAMLVEFDRVLNDANHLVVVGYSFRDDHINALIRRRFNSGNLRLTLVDPAYRELLSTVWSYQESFREHLLQLITEDRGSGERTAIAPHRVISEGAAAGLQELLRH